MKVIYSVFITLLLKLSFVYYAHLLFLCSGLSREYNVDQFMDNSFCKKANKHDQMANYYV